MSDLKFVKAEKILLSNHQSYNERWVQKHIAADPLGTENGGGQGFGVNAVAPTVEYFLYILV